MVRAGAARATARDVTDLAIGSSDWLGNGTEIVISSMEALTLPFRASETTS